MSPGAAAEAEAEVETEQEAAGSTGGAGSMEIWGTRVEGGGREGTGRQGSRSQEGVVELRGGAGGRHARVEL